MTITICLETVFAGCAASCGGRIGGRVGDVVGRSTFIPAPISHALGSENVSKQQQTSCLDSNQVNPNLGRRCFKLPDPGVEAFGRDETAAAVRFDDHSRPTTGA